MGGAAAPVRAQESVGLEASVVRIVNYSQRYSWHSPWDVGGVSEASGSGFVVEGGMIMTNAHVVSDSRHLLILVHNDPQPYEAEVVHVAHDCDLALVRPLDPEALGSVPPLLIGDLPELGAAVETLGYPVGGDRLSSTRGVVSRIEEQLFLHSGMDVHLTVQTDAAINPGNSGGPVVKDGLVVGVAFQANLGLEGAGYFIPPEVIARFLEDVEDGRYDGYPELGVDYEAMENPSARHHAGLREQDTGVRVRRVYKGTSADGHLRIGDVILNVNGYRVANDGTIDDGERRIDFGLLIDRRQIGERVSVRVHRDGERVVEEFDLTGSHGRHLREHAYDRSPRYFVYGGLLFMPLSLELMKTFGGDWYYTARNEMRTEFLVEPLKDEVVDFSERVVLLRRLRHPVNADMAWFRYQVVDQVNGKPIESLEQLIETLEGHDGDFHVLEFHHQRRVGVLDRKRVEEANAEILERYGIAKDRRL
ncbi:hypothetical protein ABI59_07825 [Acidobacteria bacterium Mor1]|nr:hypothetical protein ABI59_07825 [Acidobacteria bacterium Mor1]